MRKYKIIDRLIVVIFIILMCSVLFLSLNLLNSKYKYEAKETKKNDIDKVQTASYMPPVETKTTDNIDEFEYLNIPLSKELQKFTYNMCQKYDVDYNFILALMKTESDFKSDAKCANKIGGGFSIGLCQLNENYISEFSELTGIKNFDIHNDKHNIEACVAKIRALREYWISQGILDEENLFYLITNCYNMGIRGYTEVIRKQGLVSRSYDRRIFKYKNALESKEGLSDK